jgi:hypothetical protein
MSDKCYNLTNFSIYKQATLYSNSRKEEYANHLIKYACGYAKAT